MFMVFVILFAGLLLYLLLKPDDTSIERNTQVVIKKDEKLPLLVFKSHDLKANHQQIEAEQNV